LLAAQPCNQYSPGPGLRNTGDSESGAFLQLAVTGLGPGSDSLRKLPVQPSRKLLGEAWGELLVSCWYIPLVQECLRHSLAPVHFVCSGPGPGLWNTGDAESGGTRGQSWSASHGRLGRKHWTRSPGRDLNARSESGGNRPLDSGDSADLLLKSRQ
jgi:hypothetical protein